MKTKKATSKLILGHMPFVGVSYQSIEKDQEYSEKFRKKGVIRKVIQAALDIGVKKFAIASQVSSPLASLHLKELKTVVKEGYEIEIIPCIMIPISLQKTPVDAFRRWATYIEIEQKKYGDIKNRVLEDPILNFRVGWKQKLPSSKPYTQSELQKIAIDWSKIETRLETFNDLPVNYIEPGSETDFLAMAGRLDLLGELIDRIKERGFPRILFGVHHAGTTIPILEEGLEGFQGYLTPMNTLGIMMLPTKATAESAIRNTRKSVYAIKPLAGGRIHPKNAFNYVFNFQIQGCMIGCASITEVKKDFNTAIQVLMNKLNRDSS